MLNYNINETSKGYEALVACGFKQLFRGPVRNTYEAAIRDAFTFLNCLETEVIDNNTVRSSVTCIKTRKAL